MQLQQLSTLKTQTPTRGSACTLQSAQLAPWEAIRDPVGTLLGIRCVADVTAYQVRVYLAGDGVFAQSLPITARLGTELWFRARFANTHTPAAVIVVRWFSQTGQELLWQVPVC